MAKRKAGVNTIIYELDNDDIEISSDEEAKEPKKRHLDDANSVKSYVNKNIKDLNSADVISLDSSEEILSENEPSKQIHNGGKTSSETTTTTVEKPKESPLQDKSPNVNEQKSENNIPSTTILDEDIVIDSPANSDLGVVGCENRTPLVTVRFKDSKLAHTYKKTIKDFLLNLLKKQSDDNSNNLSDSDNELDIWEEDLVNESSNIAEVDDGLFFVDTEPCDDKDIDVPKYRQNSSVICNSPEKEDSPQMVAKRRHTCFNCDGDHQLRECPLPRDNQKIAEKRKTVARVGRYHVEDDQKYGHLVPGRISATLRSAMGLKRYELPLYIYRMRLLGYPPGWLEEARISHSGITMFDSTGNAILDPEEEEGELCEPGSKDKYDIKKILDFPGFNVPASSRYVEEAHLYGLPPISEQDSKMLMLQNLAPNAVKAYKRKKLLFFPSSNNNSLQGQAEMELDSGDEVAEFPSVPPLPDEEPPPAPPPPPPLPNSPPPDISEKTEPSKKEIKKTPKKKISPKKDSNKIEDCDKNSNERVKKKSSPKKDTKEEAKKTKVDKDESTKVEENDKPSIKNKILDIEPIDLCSDVEAVDDAPGPEGFITIDEDYDSVSQLSSSGRNSPSLDDLEQKKRLLLNALESNNPESDTSINIIDSNKNDDITDTEIEELLESAVKKLEKKRKDDKKGNSKTTVDKLENEANDVEIAEVNDIEITITSVSNKKESIQNDKDESANTNKSNDKILNDKSSVEIMKSCENDDKKEIANENSDHVSTPAVAQDKTGQVKTTQYGTPVLNVASDYVKLPTEDKFAKDICDVINFENLPNSTGKFKQISSLLKKVKTVVDRIQES